MGGAGMWICTKCNTHNEGSFCSVCGMARPERTNQNSMREATVMLPKKKKNQTVLILSIILLIAVLILVGMIIIWGKDKKDSGENGSDISGMFSDNQEKPTGISPDNTEKGESARPVNGEKNISEDATDQSAEQEAEVKPKESLPPIRIEPPKVSESPSDSNPIKPKNRRYNVYLDGKRDFRCAYPADFKVYAPKGINAVHAFISPDSDAVMTFRVSENTQGLSVKEAINEFYSAYGEKPDYSKSGINWYAGTVKFNGRQLYRKCHLLNGKIYCMDFEASEQNFASYEEDIEYIANSFSVI